MNLLTTRQNNKTFPTAAINDVNMSPTFLDFLFLGSAAFLKYAKSMRGLIRSTPGDGLVSSLNVTGFLFLDILLEVCILSFLALALLLALAIASSSFLSTASKSCKKSMKTSGLSLIRLQQFPFFLVPQWGKFGHKMTCQTCLNNKIYV